MKLQGRETPEGRGFGKESFHRTDDTEDSSGVQPEDRWDDRDMQG